MACYSYKTALVLSVLKVVAPYLAAAAILLDIPQLTHFAKVSKASSKPSLAMDINTLIHIHINHPNMNMSFAVPYIQSLLG